MFHLRSEHRGFTRADVATWGRYIHVHLRRLNIFHRPFIFEYTPETYGGLVAEIKTYWAETAETLGIQRLERRGCREYRRDDATAHI